MTKSSTICLVTGGTGGHVFPALAFAEHLHERFASENINLELLTEPRGSRFVNNPEGIKRTCVWPISRRPKWLYPAFLVRHGAYALAYFLKKRPKAVIGFGGYPSLMPLAVAQWLGIPTFVHEQNRYLGKANRWIARRAHRVWLSHPTDVNVPRHHVVGNFIRKSLCNVAPWNPPEAGMPLRVLIVGGSQGAAVLGANLAELLSQTQLPLEIVHQCRDGAAVESVYRKAQIPHYVTPFLQDMASRYAWAHLVIARSGASTVGELMAVRRPAIFVPFASATEGDQKYNAAHAETWSWSIHENNLDTMLVPLLQSIGNNTKLLTEKMEGISPMILDMDTVWNDMMKVVKF